MTGEPIRPQVKPVRAAKEPQRLRQVSAKRAARIAAGEQPIARSWMKKGPPRRKSHHDYDAGREEFARAQDCIGRSAFPGHICVGVNEASHERNPQGQLPTGTGRKEPSRLTVSKCSELHRHWTNATGPFAGWSNDDRHAFMAPHIDATNALWDALTEEQREWWRDLAARKAAEWLAARRSA